MPATIRQVLARGGSRFRRLGRPDGRAARLAYYEPHRLNNLPTSLLDYNDAKRGLEPPAERRAANDATTALHDRPTATKPVVLPPKRDSQLGS
jgi:hypothetical protein